MSLKVDRTNMRMIIKNIHSNKLIKLKMHHSGRKGGKTAF